MDASRAAVIRDLVASHKWKRSMPLKQWPDALREFLALHPLYEAWCEPPGPGPGPPPADNRQTKAWEEKKQKWEAARKAFAERMQQRRTKTDEFAAWLGKHDDLTEDNMKVVAALQAVCTAIEKLPGVEPGKKETLALLESMQAADLQMTGALVVWPPSEPKKQCVLATFAHGKDAVQVRETEANARQRGAAVAADDTSRTAPDLAAPQGSKESGPFQQQ
jgi:hypothetical protein